MHSLMHAIAIEFMMSVVDQGGSVAVSEKING